MAAFKATRNPPQSTVKTKTMVAMANLEIPSGFLRRYMSSALDVIIHVNRFADGKRRVTSLQEITGMEGDVITLQEIFSYERKGIDAEGEIQGAFQFHGVRPRFIGKFKLAGISVPLDMFDPTFAEE